ncbi:putative transporter [Cercospora beticola]|uniref:Putative transporter n=1 Tax=Cercospora beticola TaxID=122368 RepID=A0A2G5HQN1_CERBT|nr:putative transporter [Cercospora beticola]PIA94844.1 putative transporter [Cercospora beticola]WPB05043.1 hypothetical protein RHO25_009691 [Cercospora beticola]CAK1364819.1 unnamed protein product [Cercospora beticola]
MTSFSTHTSDLSASIKRGDSQPDNKPILENEKTHVFQTAQEEISPSASLSCPSFTEQEQKSIIRRIDVRVVLLLSLMYTCSLIDRVQIGLAMITGMGADLSLTGTQYTTINAVFFGPYVVLQFPSTILLRKIGPKKFLASTTLLWGMVTIAGGFVRKYEDMIALRCILGACEAGFFPACLYLLMVWYPRYDLQKRNAALLIIGMVSSAFSGILAFGISHLSGHGVGPSFWGKLNIQTGIREPGIAGWRWIFILYGTATCIVSVLSWWVLVDFPEKIALGTAHKTFQFLTKEEATWAIQRIEADRKDAMPTEFNLREYINNAWDLKLWVFSLLILCQATVGYGIGFALPFLLMEGMGFSLTVSQCLCTPPYVLAGVSTWFVAYYSDKWRIRSPFILVNSCFAFVGICLIGYVETAGVRYFGVFLAAVAGLANAPCLLTWQANNVRGQWKRALVSTFAVGAGAIGGVIGSLVFKPGDTPHYTMGIATCLVAQGLTIFLVLLLLWKFTQANRRAASGGKLIGGLPGFRYTL